MYTLKKSLGQHFLKDESISQNIVDSLKGNSFTQLLEVGPGGGALTKYLLTLEGIDFKAVELDKEKIAFLEKTYPAIQGKLISMDVLKMDKPFEGPFTIIGNFPYNISSQILFKVLDWREDVQQVVGMFQKEVAQRVAAKHGSKTYGILSVLIQAYFKVDYLFEVHENAFTPPPKVKSAVIKLTPLDTPLVTASPKKLKTLVKLAFNQRRKMLRNGVKSIFDAETLQDPLFSKRAEQLSVEEFGALTFRMQ